MSQFSFPRINFTGKISIDVATGNNDDYAGVVRISDSINVQPVLNGNRTDAEFLDWVTRIQWFANPQTLSWKIPGEWNYFGDMGIRTSGIKVTAIQKDYNTLDTSDPLVGAEFSLNQAMLIDVNPEDSSCSQVFCDNMTLKQGTTTHFSGKPSKSATRWINFTRSMNFGNSAGGSASFFSVIPVADPASNPFMVQYFGDLTNVKGIMIRYNLYEVMARISNAQADRAQWEEIEEMYQQPNLRDRSNPANGNITGTISPWYEGEMESITLGRYLVPSDTNFVPNPNIAIGVGNGPNFSMAPVVAQVANGYVSLDLANSIIFGADVSGGGPNPDPIPIFDIGTLSLQLLQNGTAQTIGTVKYQDPNNPDYFAQSGGMADVQIPASLQGPIEAGDFQLVSSKYNTLLGETDYMIASDQFCAYSDQDDPPNNWDSQGTAGPIYIQGVRKGVRPTIADPLPIVAVQFKMTPNTDSNATGEVWPLSIPTSTGEFPILPALTNDRGCFLYQLIPSAPIDLNGITITDSSSWPVNPVYPNANTGFIAYTRILPKDDIQQYIDNPALLTWDILYEKVLRYYRLIFPAMEAHLPFDETTWKNNANTIFTRVQASLWDNFSYMPRSRDLSKTRRQMIEIWLKKYMVTPPPPPPVRR